MLISQRVSLFFYDDSVLLVAYEYSACPKAMSFIALKITDFMAHQFDMIQALSHIVNYKLYSEMDVGPGLLTERTTKKSKAGNHESSSTS